MLKSTFLSAWRSIVKYRAYTILNIGGLSFAIGSFYLLLLYAQDELSFDRFHEKSDRIYRVTSRLTNGTLETAMSGQPWGPAMVSSLPQFEAYTRSTFYFNNTPVRSGDEIVFEEKILFVDSNFFDVFDFQLLEGDLSHVLDDPSEMVITESMAAKYFGETHPVGEVMSFNFDGTFSEFMISGIAKDPPANSHLTFNMLFSKQADFRMFYSEPPNNWRLHNGFTYVVLAPGVSKEQALSVMPEFFRERAGDNFIERYEPGLQPITDIHLHSNMFGELTPNGNMAYVKVALFLSFFIMLIGSINYINLTTALSVKRAKEVGARKVLGAHRHQLTAQFLAESVLVGCWSVLIAAIIINLLLPSLNEMTDKQLVLHPVIDGLRLLSIGILVGLISGIYPAIVLSGFKPTTVLKGNFQSSKKGLKQRRGLIIFQFTLSLALFVGAGVIYEQSSYIKDKELGFEHSGLVALNGATTEQIIEKLPIFRQNLSAFPEIQSVTPASSFPSRLGLATRYKPDGFLGSDDELPTVHTIFTDHHVIETLGFQIIAGRGYDENIASDSSAFIVNETAADLFGWDDPIGQSLSASIPGSSTLERHGRVIGMVKDFHFESLHAEIKPLVMRIESNRFYNILVKFDGNRYQEAMALMEKEWNEQFPEQAFNYLVLKDSFDELHQSDFQLQKIITAGAILAVLIASIGLFGLATFLTQQKVKEIGIRKVLGASQSKLVLLLNREFAVPVLAAIGLGTPLSYYLLSLWLDNFAYRVSFNLWLIPLAGLAVFLIALVTVTWKSLSAARANPVQSLRNDG